MQHRKKLFVPIVFILSGSIFFFLGGKSSLAQIIPPTGSLANTKIAFPSDRDGNSEIYMMNADGTNQVNLTNHPAGDTNPSWSPDGMKIAFASERDGNSEIYMMNADGTNLIRLTNHPKSDDHPSWSPDGKKIAFTSNRNGNNDIYVMNTDGTNPVNLTNNATDDELPEWSPDGTKIAFMTYRDGPTSEVYVMNADGSNPVNLTQHPANDLGPSWSPDGTKIAFASDRDGNSEIYIMNADGSDPVNRTRNRAQDIYTHSWSPFLPEPLYRAGVFLHEGPNLISLPLQPPQPLTASTLAAQIGSTIVIKLDPGERFVSYIPATQAGEDFPIEMGKGYIVNLLADKTVVWEGGPWGEKIAPAPASSPPVSTWAFVVAGQFEVPDEAVRDLHLAVVKNLRTGETVSVSIHPSKASTFTAVFADLTHSPVVWEGDMLEIQVSSSSGNLLFPPVQRRVRAVELQRAYLTLRFDAIRPVPTRSALFQNYPNPFNPETWIPFQLAKAANVEITIYSAAGRSVRHLTLGHRPAGIYLHRDRAASWDGRDERGQLLPSGIYFYRLQAGEFSQTRKMLLLKSNDE